MLHEKQKIPCPHQQAEGEDLRDRGICKRIPAQGSRRIPSRLHPRCPYAIGMRLWNRRVRQMTRQTKAHTWGCPELGSQPHASRLPPRRKKEG